MVFLLALSIVWSLTAPAAETDRWVSEIRAVMAAHEKETAVHGTLRVRVLEGRNLSTRDLSGLANPYWSAYLESQVWNDNERRVRHTRLRHWR